jgi:hypothetical protein
MSNPLARVSSHGLLLRRRLSPERFDPYERACAQDLDAAVRLYEWNVEISSAFYEVLGILEVVLRNALHDHLTEWHRRTAKPGNWYDDPGLILDSQRRHDVADARLRLRRDAKIETPGRVVAELTFGFWRFLLSKRYETTLWTPALRHAFPGLRPARRQTLYTPVHELVRLRNRIAHHEPIHNRPLTSLHEAVLRTAGYLDPGIELWIRGLSRVPIVLDERPYERSVTIHSE